MPPRAPPKVHHIQLRTHKLSVFVTVPPSATIQEIKEEALSALSWDINRVEDVPNVQTVDDFELHKAVKEKGNVKGFEALDATTRVRDHNLASYDSLYIQFKDPSTGEALPITYTQPSVDDEDQPMEEDIPPMSSVSKGKRKAVDD